MGAYSDTGFKHTKTAHVDSDFRWSFGFKNKNTTLNTKLELVKIV